MGTAFKINEPIEVKRLPVNTPDEHMLKSLKVFQSIEESKRSNVNVIRKLIHHGLWKYAEGSKGTSVELEENGTSTHRKDDAYTKLQRKEAVLYQRGYIDVWKKREEWIERSDTNGKRYKLTEKGQRYLDIFCPDVIFKIDESEK